MIQPSIHTIYLYITHHTISVVLPRCRQQPGIIIWLEEHSAQCSEYKWILNDLIHITNLTTDFH